MMQELGGGNETMGYRYAILGAGRQGVAAAYDLALFGQADAVALLDVDLKRAQQAASRVDQLSRRKIAQATRVDVRNSDQLSRALKGFDACLSAVPYSYNVKVSQAALRARVSLCDLGGSTATVFEQLKLGPKARKAQIAIVPDCGLAPGTSNLLAVHAMNRVKFLGGQPEEVKIYCGGLPQHPKPPLHYQLLFSLEGLLNEYLSPVHLLRNGKIVELEPLTELETVEFPEPVGRSEAFLTSGGTSTCPWTFKGKLKTYEYKTVRYPGHCEKFRTLRGLGLLQTEPPIKVGKGKITPREVFEAISRAQLNLPEEPDLVVLRVICRGAPMGSMGSAISVQIDHLDVYDPTTRFTAMERTTGFSAAIVATLLAQKKIKSGAHTPERAVPIDAFMRALTQRNFRFTEMIRKPLEL
jgi:lysine 6-dehydrogenase